MPSKSIPRHLMGDLMRIALMEIVSLIALRLTVVHLFGIDIFDFHTAIGQVLAGSISIAAFVGIYKVFTVEGKLQDIGERVLHGGGTPTLND